MPPIWALIMIASWIAAINKPPPISASSLIPFDSHVDQDTGIAIAMHPRQPSPAPLPTTCDQPRRELSSLQPGLMAIVGAMYLDDARATRRIRMTQRTLLPRAPAAAAAGTVAEPSLACMVRK